MNSRLKLDSILKELCSNVYYQPPANLSMKYPAIVYSRSDINNDFADNKVYSQSHEYMVTVIDKNPDSEIVDKVSQLLGCRYNRNFKSDNLNHDVFIISI